MNREKFSSRLGFILISAGCAIGLGNVWRFPYVAGKNGGAIFVLIYLFFLAILGLPIMVMELSVGRASQKSAACSFDELEPAKSKWHLGKYAIMAGNYILMMFYTTIGGWMILYFLKMLKGDFISKSTTAIAEEFDSILTQPLLLIGFMIFIIVFCFGICSLGLQNGVEKVTKIMMLCLLGLMGILAINSLLIPGSGEGFRFYLFPDFSKLKENGIWNTIFAAMSQAFFTLSIGIGSIAIFGSYIDKERSLTGEALSITILDTAVALVAGLIIFPSCFAYHINPDSGPNLIFITLPKVFEAMTGGRFWGALFFLFMSFAAISTIVAVFENIISYGMDLLGWSRKKSVLINMVTVIILSLPCALGFNVLSGIHPLGGESTILDFEDFLVSGVLLPLGSLFYLVFCVSRYGWGFENFIQEANTGKGVKFPKGSRLYLTYILPLIVLFIFVQGIINMF